LAVREKAARYLPGFFDK